MSDIYRIVTPENIELDYEIAGIGSRFMAISIDTLIQSVFLIGIGYAFHLMHLGSLASEIKDLFTSLAGALIAGLILVVLIGYFIILESVMNGQTVGKKLVNIRVRKEGGYAPSFWDILLRNIIRLIDMFPFFYFCGLISMFCNSKSKRLGDFAAGTIVIKEISAKKINQFLNGASFQKSVIPYTGDDNAQYPWLNSLVAQISQTDYLLVKNLISRKNVLTNYASLAWDLLRKLAGQNGLEVLQLNNITDIDAIIQEMATQYERMHF